MYIYTQRVFAQKRTNTSEDLRIDSQYTVKFAWLSHATGYQIWEIRIELYLSEWIVPLWWQKCVSGERHGLVANETTFLGYGAPGRLERQLTIKIWGCPVHIRYGGAGVHAFSEEPKKKNTKLIIEGLGFIIESSFIVGTYVERCEGYKKHAQLRRCTRCVV